MSDRKSEPKIYVGRGKTAQFDDGGHIHSIRINLTRLPKEHMWTSEKGNTYIRLKVSQLREPDEDGNDNTVFVDTWKPDKSAKRTEPAPDRAPAQSGSDDKGDSLPF